MIDKVDYKILIVDDEPDLLEILAFQLEVLGCHPFQAKNGREAFDLIKNQQQQWADPRNNPAANAEREWKNRGPGSRR